MNLKINSERLRRSWPLLLIFAGTALLIYVGLQYVHMYREQHRLAKQFQEQQHALDGQGPLTHKVSAEEMLTRLYIPSIKLDAVVVEGTTRRALLMGPGHLKQTPEPGENGNSVISAHRDTFFRHIYELHKGDVITVQREGKEYHYMVVGKKIVDPEDMSVIRSTADPELTLITCYPTYYIGPAPQRLVVFAKLVPTPPASSAAEHRHEPEVATGEAQ